MLDYQNNAGNSLLVHKNQNEVLENGLLLADKFINKNYLYDLNKNKVLPLSVDSKKVNYLRLYRITKLVYDPEENVNDKLISVYSALESIGSSAILIVDSNEDEIEFYLGIRSEENAATGGKILEKSIKGNYPGSNIEGLKNSQIENLLQSIITSDFENTEKSIAAVSIIPSTRDENKDKFVQGIEKFLDTMMGEKYTAIFIATPLSKGTLEQRKRGLEELYSTLSSFSKVTLSYGENYSEAVTKGMVENFTSSISNSIANSNSHSKSQSNSISHSSSTGTSFNYDGFGRNKGNSKSYTKGYSSSSSWSKSVTEGTSESKSSGINNSDTITKGDTRNLTIEYYNKSVQGLMQKTEEHLERIKLSESFGLWECACYFISQDVQTVMVAANSYKALMSGNQTSVENSFVNLWSASSGNDAATILEYLKYGIHPQIQLPNSFYVNEQFVTPANLVSGHELPIIMGLPQKSTSGVTVIEMAEFGRGVYVKSASQIEREIPIGQVMHMGEVEKNKVNLNLDSFSSHCFITGSTGSGKSNTTYKLLEEFIKQDIKFLVIEPAKGEYRKVFGALKGINIFSTNPKLYKMLKLNPFKFNENIHILEHLDRLIEIFNACWPMYAAMPAILKESIEKTYISCGWDLMNSVHVDNGKNKFPTFKDVLNILPEIIDSSRYSSDTKGDYVGALVTRMNSLTNGITGQIFCDSYDIADEILFDENTIVDLSRVGSAETKSLLMGILIMKLNEYRVSTSKGENLKLQHITVIEEAHNLLRRTSMEQSQEGSNLQGKSVEMISNSIAEMRTYGEGFIIIDQSPTSVDISAIKNTNTKMIMRLPERADCLAVGNAVGLNDHQILELSKLKTGAAVIIQNNWLEPVMTQVDRCEELYKAKDGYVSQRQISILRGAVASELLRQFRSSCYDLEKMKNIINECEITNDKKEEMINFVRYVYRALSKSNCVSYFSEVMTNLLACRDLFDILQLEIKNSKAETKKDLSKEDIVVIERWYKKFMKELDQYAIFANTSDKRLLSKYLIYHHALKNQKSFLAYTVVFSKR